MAKTTRIADYRGFTRLQGNETRVEWRAAGGVLCVAERGWRGPQGFGTRGWTLIEGPRPLVGRNWRHLRDLRQAASEA